MTDGVELPSLFETEQNRMSRLQVYDWGTFQGLHDISIAERGFLFVGRSGAGKSTLLDAFSALLVPPRWLDFNAAAREADRSGRDRNVVSYVRGAWAEQKDEGSGDVLTQYLRKGTTWSALGLTYSNGCGRNVVLVQLFWLRGQGSGNADLRRQYLIFEEPFELRQLETFASTDFNVRALKQQFPKAFVHEDFQPYRERFSRLLGLESESVLRLLNKTQSAKNLGDLNSFLREFMLEKPPTFEDADRLVAEFGELSAAHQAVVTAREQVQLLIPARERHEQWQGQIRQRDTLMELQKRVPEYRELCRMGLLAKEIENLHVAAEGAAGEVRRRESLLESSTATLRSLELQHRDAGGDRIEQWEAEKKGLETQRGDRVRKRGQAEEAASALGWKLPETPTEFAELLGDARREMEHREKDEEVLRDQLVNTASKMREVRSALLEAHREVEVLLRQSTNIPSHMLELRHRIAEAIAVPEASLPFAGELIEVKPSETEWQGAIERLLHGFALSVLVSEKHYPALSQHINGVHLGQRLVYHRIAGREDMQLRPLTADSMVSKLNVKESAQAEWLRGELRSGFNYMCVESGLALRKTERGLTREGQIKHGKTRHEKDDRRTIDDRRTWVLGFNNLERLGLYQRLAQEQADQLAALDREDRAHKSQGVHRAERAKQCQRLLTCSGRRSMCRPLLRALRRSKRRFVMRVTATRHCMQLGCGLRISESWCAKLKWQSMTAGWNIS